MPFALPAAASHRFAAGGEVPATAPPLAMAYSRGPPQTTCVRM